MKLNKRKKSFPAIEKIISLIHLAEKLKDETRHQWTTSGKQESVADHSWRLSLMTILCCPYSMYNLDFNKALIMAIIHDLVEAEAGDQHFLIKNKRMIEQQSKKEKNAIKRIKKIIEGQTGDDLFTIWNEFNELSSNEARFVKALDKLEGYIQQNEASISTWTEEETASVFYYLDQFCDFDPFLKQLKEFVIAESLEKIKKSNIDINSVVNKLKESTEISAKIESRIRKINA